MSVMALQAHFRALRGLIEGLSHEVYGGTPSRTSGSVGQHVRHCLDHARALLGVAPHGDLTYDARLRGTRAETDPAFAADEIVRVCIDFEQLDDMPLDAPISLRTIVADDMPAVRAATTLGREIAFVVQHTIHHCALIAILLEREGVAVPRRFGYAPSTPGRVRS